MGFPRNAAILIAAILAVTGIWSGTARAASCELHELVSFPVGGRADGRVVVPVTVNGTQEKFLVDTGAVVTEITAAVADALDLSVHVMDPNVELYGIDGSRIRKYAKVDTFGVGAGRMPDVPMMIAPNGLGTGKGAPNGLLAPDILRNFDLDFDFGAHKLNIMLQDHCPGHVTYWTSHYGTVPFSLNVDDGHIEVTVSLDGKNIRAIVDTGATASLIDSRVARDLFGLGGGKSGLDPVAGAGPDSLVRFTHRFSSLSFGDVTVRNPRIAILEDKAQAAFFHQHRTDKDMFDPVHAATLNSPPLILGMDVLTKLHLYIAYGEEKLYVTAARPGKPADARPAAAN